MDRAALVSIEVAVVGLIIAWLQLEYAKRRDKLLDFKSAWTEVHKAMMDFRLKQAILDHPDYWGKTPEQAAIDAFSSLHFLRGQLDRTPDSPLAIEMSNFLEVNWISSDKWRGSADFNKTFDKYIHEAQKRTIQKKL